MEQNDQTLSQQYDQWVFLKGKVHITENLDSDPSLSDSSPRKSDFPDDIKWRTSKSKGQDKNKKCQKHKKQDLSDSLSRDSDLSEKLTIRKRPNKKNRHQKKDPINLCANLTAKLLTTAYKFEYYNIQNRWGSAPAPYLLSYLCIITWDDIFPV